MVFVSQSSIFIKVNLTKLPHNADSLTRRCKKKKKNNMKPITALFRHVLEHVCPEDEMIGMNCANPFSRCR